MADPVIVACAANAWTKAATAVQSGFIHLQDGVDQIWYQTYKDTGEAPPADLATAQIFGKDTKSGLTEDIGASVPIDVYVYPTQKAGSVRVDL